MTFWQIFAKIFAPSNIFAKTFCGKTLDTEKSPPLHFIDC